ncbi:MAG: thioredoxin fold domain-containing protein [Chitinophagaceae bacterium]
MKQIKILMGPMLFLPILAAAQIDTYSKGIKWSANLSWEQIKQKAKAENKYIFLDVYETWCGPCKMMDRNVFVEDSVGQFFNDKIIAVKLQMDRTSHDNEDIKKWYKDADAIGKQYQINAFPSFIFINPEGEVTDLQTGYRESHDFLNITRNALKAGKLYTDPFLRYWVLLNDYKNGIIKYDSLDYMIRKAGEINDSVARPQMMKVYKEYISSLEPKERYTKKNVEFWEGLNLSSKSIMFQYLVKDEKKIDKVKYEGFAFSIASKTIHNELVLPFFENQNKNSTVAITGNYATLLVGKIKTDSSEADWSRLFLLLRKEYSKEIAERMVLLSRVDWYRRHWNNDGVFNVWVEQVAKYPEDLRLSYFDINNQAWQAFMNVTDKKVLNSYISLMKVLVGSFSKNAIIIDTYANLLYKIGKRTEAITWQEKASIHSPNKDYIVTIEQMKQGKPTYGVQPLND